MKTLALLGAVLLSLPIQTAFALDPEEAGRQARDELDALMDKQQERKAASGKPKDAPSPSSSSSPPTSASKEGRQGSKAIEKRIPTICEGC